MLRWILEDGELPEGMGLDQNFPNPFADSTTIRYSVVDPERVILEVYDTLGRKVSTLVNRNQAPGRYIVTYSPMHLASGHYTFRLTTGSATLTRPFTIVR